MLILWLFFFYISFVLVQLKEVWCILLLRFEKAFEFSFAPFYEVNDGWSRCKKFAHPNLKVHRQFSIKDFFPYVDFLKPFYYV